MGSLLREKNQDDIFGQHLYVNHHQDRILGRRSDQSDSKSGANEDPTDARSFSIIKGREPPFGVTVSHQLPVIRGHRIRIARTEFQSLGHLGHDGLWLKERAEVQTDDDRLMPHGNFWNL